MKILLLFDKEFPVNKSKFMNLLDERSKHVEFDSHRPAFSMEPGLISKPDSFTYILQHLKGAITNYDRVFCFTEKQYEDNFFFHEHKNLTIFSFYGWNYLTDLPISNGVLYFILNYLALELDHSDFRHRGTTGCIYDFLRDKRGVDDGMREARFCSKCLKRLSRIISQKEQRNIYNDMQVLMNHLSESSRWNLDILASIKTESARITKRQPKRNNAVYVVIASPGDTAAERKKLLDLLEVRFRKDNHESRCGWRIIVNGWEDLAAQPGYPQDIINQKIISDCDFVVAVFKHSLGTPTKNVTTGKRRAASGTVEELLQALDQRKDDQPIGMAYFFSKAPMISLDSSDRERIEKEWTRLTRFKDSIKNKMIYKPYANSDELISLVLSDLEKNIIEFVAQRKRQRRS